MQRLSKVCFFNLFCSRCRALQEAQETFGVDFDYDEFSKYEQDDYEEEEDEEEDDYEEEDGERT